MASTAFFRSVKLASRFLLQNNMTYRTMSNTAEVIMEKVGSKGVITLNRPSALNSLNISMIRAIYPQLKAWDSDEEIKMIIVKSNSDKAFCAGGDVRAITGAHKQGDQTLAADFFREEYQLNNLIGTLQVPYVALINGITMGGGIGISVHGAFRVCTEKSVCAMPEIAIGFFPDVGGSYFLHKLPGKLGLFLALTGYRLQGRDVFKAGIATHFVSTDSLKTLESELMRLQIPNLHDIDRILLKFQEQCEADYKKEFALKPVMGRMNTIFQAESVEKIIEGLEKDGSEWSKKQLEVIRKGSPTSLKVTFEMLKRSSSLTLQDALKMEYRISQRFMEGNDFHEGVRAALIDKDHKPVWNPSSLSEVTDDKVNAFFERLPSSKELRL